MFLLSSTKILELEEAISEMKIIHVAGTKGKVAVLNFCHPILASIYPKFIKYDFKCSCLEFNLKFDH